MNNDSYITKKLEGVFPRRLHAVYNRDAGMWEIEAYTIDCNTCAKFDLLGLAITNVELVPESEMIRITVEQQK